MKKHTRGENPIIVGHRSWGLAGKIWGTYVDGPLEDWLIANEIKYEVVRCEEYPSGNALYAGISQEDAERMRAEAPDDVLAQAHMSRA